MQNYPVPHRKYLDKDGGEDRTYSGFSYFMDGSRRTYKIGDMVLEGKKIYLVVVARVRAGCTERDRQKKLHTQIGAELLRNCREIICIFLESMLIYVMNEFSDSGGHFHDT